MTPETLRDGLTVMGPYVLGAALYYVVIAYPLIRLTRWFRRDNPPVG